MGFEYDDVNFWSELGVLSGEVRAERFAEEKALMNEFLKDEEKAFTAWRTFFLSQAKKDTEIFKWLLTLRPEVVSLRCPVVLEHGKRSFKGITLLQMMLLLMKRPLREFLDLLKESLTRCDVDGNSCLFYAALRGKMKLYGYVWLLLEADGESVLLPGPQSAAVLIKADCTKVPVKNLFAALGSPEAAISLAIAEKSPKLANLFIKALAETDFDTAMNLAMTEPIVYFSTLYTLVLEALQLNRELAFPFEIVLERLFHLCNRFQHYRQFLLIISKFQCDNRDVLVGFTGTPFKLLNLLFQHRDVRLDLSLVEVQSCAFDMPSKIYGSYLHILCQRIRTKANKAMGLNKWLDELDAVHFPALLSITKARHWCAVDSNGKKPSEYLGVVMKRLDPGIALKIKNLSAGIDEPILGQDGSKMESPTESFKRCFIC